MIDAQFIQYFLIGFLLLILLIDKQMRGYLTTFFQCKASRGQKVFLQIQSLSGAYFKSAKVLQGQGLQYKTEGLRGEKQLLIIPDDFDFDIIHGFATATFDEQHNKLWNSKQVLDLKKEENGDKKGDNIIRFKTYSVTDPTTADSYFERAIKAPAIKSRQETLKKGMQWLMVGGAVAAAYFAWKNNQMLENVLARQNMLKEALEQLGAVIN
jgi:hypothetical protein